LKPFYRSETSSYPNLIQALRERVRLESVTLASSASSVAILVALWAAALPITFEIGGDIAGCVLLAALGYATWRIVAHAHATREERRKLADRVKVYRAMIQCMERNRLEHDISVPNVQILEACAERYRQAEISLDMWHPGESTKAVRNRLRAGIDEAMCDAILVHRDALPDHPSHLSFGVQIGKLANQFIPGIAESPSGPVEPAFTQARKIADQLLTVSLEVEKAAKEITGDVRPSTPAAALDSALGELRLISQAEEELRQDLHG
jgi:hypothetical protein